MPIAHLMFPCAPEGQKTVAQGVSPGKRSQDSLAPEGRESRVAVDSFAPPGLLPLPLPAHGSRRGLYCHAPPGLKTTSSQKRDTGAKTLFPIMSIQQPAPQAEAVPSLKKRAIEVGQYIR